MVTLSLWCCCLQIVATSCRLSGGCDHDAVVSLHPWLCRPALLAVHGIWGILPGFHICLPYPRIAHVSVSEPQQCFAARGEEAIDDQLLVTRSVYIHLSEFQWLETFCFCRTPAQLSSNSSFLQLESSELQYATPSRLGVESDPQESTGEPVETGDRTKWRKFALVIGVCVRTSCIAV